MIDWFTPGYKGGGPIRSVTNLIAALSDEFEFSIVTSNMDDADTDDPHPRPYPNIESDVWLPRENKARVFYFSHPNLNYQKMREVIENEEFNFLYLNSLFSPKFTVLPLFAALARRRKPRFKIVLAPRGSLQSGALAQKRFKKRVFLIAAKLIGLGRRVIWQATDEQEKNDIAIHFGKSLDVRIAPNLPAQNQALWLSVPKQKGAVRFFFASRISPKKNLEFFLERLKGASGKIIFDIFGPPQDESYVRLCEKIIKDLPANVQAVFRGTVSPAELESLIRSYHFSVLTTRGENFGHSIFESFIAGKPILLSDQTPWRNLEKQKIGWDISLAEPDLFDQAIKRCVEMDQEQYDNWSKAAWTFAEEYQRNPQAIEQSRKLFS